MELLRRDGADGADPNKVRSAKQRLADVVYELLANRDADTGESLDSGPGVKAKASTQVILVAPLGVVDGTNPDGHVEMIGVGPVSRRILATLTPDTDLAGMIFDRAGRPLWLGRKQRLANAAQRLAVAIRDGGCFECGAPMHRCELHHIQEWHRDERPHRHRQSGRRLPPAPQVARNRKPRSPTHRRRIPNPTPNPTPRRPRTMTRGEGESAARAAVRVEDRAGGTCPGLE